MKCESSISIRITRGTLEAHNAAATAAAAAAADDDDDDDDDVVSWTRPEVIK